MIRTQSQVLSRTKLFTYNIEIWKNKNPDAFKVMASACFTRGDNVMLDRLSQYLHCSGFFYVTEQQWTVLKLPRVRVGKFVHLRASFSSRSGGTWRRLAVYWVARSRVIFATDRRSRMGRKREPACSLMPRGAESLIVARCTFWAESNPLDGIHVSLSDSTSTVTLYNGLEYFCP